MQVAYVIADLSCIALTFVVVLVARYAAHWKLYSVSGYVSLLRTVIPQGYIGVLLLYAALIVLFSQQHGLYKSVTAPNCRRHSWWRRRCPGRP